jgi:hypothetical protein
MPGFAGGLQITVSPNDFLRDQSIISTLVYRARMHAEDSTALTTCHIGS